MTTLIVGENILLARNVMQRIVLEHALRHDIPRERFWHRPTPLLERCLLGNDDYILLGARRPDLLLQCDADAIDQVVEAGEIPRVTRWVIAGLKFNNAIE